MAATNHDRLLFTVISMVMRLRDLSSRYWSSVIGDDSNRRDQSSGGCLRACAMDIDRVVALLMNVVMNLYVHRDECEYFATIIGVMFLLSARYLDDHFHPVGLPGKMSLIDGVLRTLGISGISFAMIMSMDILPATLNLIESYRT